MLRLFFSLSVIPFWLLFAGDIVDAPYEPDYAKRYPERHHWKNLRDSFMKHKYKEILRRHGFELSCGGCSTVFLDVALSVDTLGSARIHSVERAKACGRQFPEAMRREFLDYLTSYAYPSILRGTSVRLRLGTGLSC